MSCSLLVDLVLLARFGGVFIFLLILGKYLGRIGFFFLQ
jgi:hypothetical protein